LAAEVYGWSAARRSLVNALMREKAAAVKNSGTGRTADRDSPLSFAQQRLWFLDQLEPHSAFYNIPGFGRLAITNIAAFHRALKEIVRRHEALRTRFAEVKGRPVQVIAAEQEVKVQSSDLRGQRAQEQENEIMRLSIAESQQPFDLEQGPLWRIRLVRLGETNYLLMVTMHHIISDGWSMGVFFRELAQLYEGLSVGRERPLPELPVQYADFARWQRETMQGEVLEKHLGYWKQQLAGAPEVLNLPWARKRPAVQSFRGAAYGFRIPAVLGELKRLGQEEGATLFMTLLAAFQVLLSRYTRSTDIVIGSPIANRTRAELEGLIGFFVNTLVLRGDLSGNPRFRELLRRIRIMTVDAYAHQDLPFEKLVEEIQPQRNLSYNPLFQVMMAGQNPATDIMLANGTLEVNEAVRFGTTSKFDLALFIGEHGPDIIAGFEYSTDLFEMSAIERMAGHLRTLLTSIAADPEQRLSELALLTAGERKQLLRQWSGRRQDLGVERCVHELFEEAVARHSEQVAVVSGERQLRYGELNARANRLARYLRRQGVGREAHVGICMERSLEMMVAVLGVLKAGGAYVPLDPHYPAERLRYMWENCGAGLLLADGAAAALAGFQGQVIDMDRAREEIEREEAHNLTPVASPDNLAYLIYTSGSTGRPKAAMLSHRSLQNVFMAQRELFGMSVGVKVVQFSSFSFDAFVFELLMSLLAGCQLHIPSWEIAKGGLGLTEFCQDHEIQIATLPISVARSLSSDLPDLQTLILAGERCPAEIPARWGLARRVFNAYGPTEGSIWTTAYLCEPSNDDPPIGRPIPNVEVYILDEELQPVPIGVGGQLCIGGVALARGYYGNPEATAEKFVPHPYSSKGGERLYLSGDLARYLEDGQIEFLGRMDEQVKVRGFRIEPGEIEAVLRQHEGVIDAVVGVREDKQQRERRLVAWVVGKEGAESGVEAGELREWLKGKLPEYMVPAWVVKVPELGLLPNGKIDRRRLPEPDGERPELRVPWVGPRTEMEEQLVKIWQEVLPVQRIGVRDSFFDVGGHSLLATQVMARIRDTFNVELALRTIFETPTIEALALVIHANRDTVHPVTAEQGSSAASYQGTSGEVAAAAFSGEEVGAG
jgi:amino acid adenylation domain-containing protein